jgi:hypothetical protein
MTEESVNGDADEVRVIKHEGDYMVVGNYPGYGRLVIAHFGSSIDEGCRAVISGRGHAARLGVPLVCEVGINTAADGSRNFDEDPE